MGDHCTQNASWLAAVPISEKQRSSPGRAAALLCQRALCFGGEGFLYFSISQLAMKRFGASPIVETA